MQGLCDVLNVRVKAPLPLRIERIMRRKHMTEEQATEFVAERDTLVADFARTSYGLSPDDPGMFDLVIDTGKVDRDMAAGWLVEAAKAMACRAGDPTAAALKVDQVAQRAVAKEFSAGKVSVRKRALSGRRSGSVR